ncbi:hypothetical protein [Brevundimonas sp. NIBR11]|uniref:hypothetical protein n=1 Tax=Brevundimonas sp. NIBR11 TaxID=3015999 RepID=UPI0022F03D32|nr:hypothetical protein [Brevundimonas sp. NIBR11]WGM32402.1 hypothetical protein KKHFBJBL_02654 [Brevundimonas sp. NIBR11]
MFDLNKTGPVPADLVTPLVFENVRIPIADLALALDATGGLRGRRFVDCVITGPAVVVQADHGLLHNCNLGDASGDVRNLFLRAAGPMLVGCVALNDCVFEGCLFIGIGFAGTDGYVDAMVKSLSPAKA